MDFRTMKRSERKLIAKEILKQSKQYGVEFRKVDVPANLARGAKIPIHCYRNKDFLVQVFETDYADILRLSVCRTSIDIETGDWLDGISWEMLMWIKKHIGYSNHDAVEVYPRHSDIVNVANMRHLWVFTDNDHGFLPFAWRAKQVREASE